MSRELVTTPDGGSIALDWTRTLPKSDVPSHTLVVLHGLAGGSHETYVRHLLYTLLFDPIFRSNHSLPENLQAVVVNFRGCAETPVTSTQLYCGAWTDDLRQAIGVIKERVGEKGILAAIGFSLGANILVKVLRH